MRNDRAPATALDYRDLAGTLRTGDIYLAAGIRKKSIAIRFVSNLQRRLVAIPSAGWKAEWSHVGMIVIPSELGLLHVANPEDPHLWESTIDKDVADAIEHDKVEGPMLVPLLDRLRGATAGAQPHYEAFAVRRLRRAGRPFVETIDADMAWRFKDWISKTTGGRFGMRRMVSDWLKSFQWHQDAKAARALAADLAKAEDWIRRVPGIGRYAGAALQRLSGLYERWGARTFQQADRLFRQRSDFPCSILAARTLDELGLLDTRNVIPAFTPDDFANDRLPLCGGVQFDPVEPFTFSPP